MYQIKTFFFVMGESLKIKANDK